MVDKIKASRARARASRPAKEEKSKGLFIEDIYKRIKEKEKDQATWFENHIIVMPGMHEHVTVLVDKEQEEKLKQAVSGRIFTEQAGD